MCPDRRSPCPTEGEWLKASAGHPFLAIPPHVFQKQVAESDRTKVEEEPNQRFSAFTVWPIIGLCLSDDEEAVRRSSPLAPTLLDMPPLGIKIGHTIGKQIGGRPVERMTEAGGNDGQPRLQRHKASQKRH
jgi:hypothetical protein